MRKMLLAALFVGAIGLFLAAPAVAAEYPPSCDATASATTGGVGSETCTTTTANTNGEGTLYVAGASGEGALAFTGSDSTPLVVVGVAAVMIGGVLVFATRRRSAQQH
jgi:LPXTG-motif cell wall-anchored protein